jgi:ABC-2 type transport system permease protein
VDNANLIRKIPFPREIIPLSAIIAQFIYFLLSLMILFIFLGIFKIQLTSPMLFLPLMLLLQFIFVLGVSLISSALHTQYRDVKYIIEALLLCWFYLTPIFYPLTAVPSRFQRVYMLNPMTCIVTIYRDILFYGKVPDFSTTAYAFSISIVVLILGLLVFKKTESLFADLA